MCVQINAKERQYGITVQMKTPAVSLTYGQIKHFVKSHMDVDVQNILNIFQLVTSDIC